MIKLFKIIIFSFTCLSFASCSQILETVELNSLNEKKLSNIKEQDNFDIQLKTLTISEAKKAKSIPYPREVMIGGVGNNANVISESSLYTQGDLPEFHYQDYKLGVGDKITFVQVQGGFTGVNSLDNIGDDKLASIKDTNSLIESEARIGSDGSILLLGLGRLNAEGRNINELRSEVRNLLIRNGLAPNFQLEITGFLSRKALLFTNSGSKEGVIPITDRPLTLRELAASSGYSNEFDKLNLVTLKRDGQSYSISSQELFNENRTDIFIQDRDQIEFEKFSYKQGKVYALNGSGNASVIVINPSIRETMADVMFNKNGILSNNRARKSEVYLLRGQKPITAFHLDAQNASRILVAAAMELRPNDIVFVADRPIISFNRLLIELTPLRVLLRDINDENF
jgi:polysaccharide biosynthesis/export protein